MSSLARSTSATAASRSPAPRSSRIGCRRASTRRTASSRPSISMARRLARAPSRVQRSPGPSAGAARRSDPSARGPRDACPGYGASEPLRRLRDATRTQRTRRSRRLTLRRAALVPTRRRSAGPRRTSQRLRHNAASVCPSSARWAGCPPGGAFRARSCRKRRGAETARSTGGPTSARLPTRRLPLRVLRDPAHRGRADDRSRRAPGQRWRRLRGQQRDVLSALQRCEGRRSSLVLPVTASGEARELSRQRGRSLAPTSSGGGGGGPVNPSVRAADNQERAVRATPGAQP